ncbi:Bacteriophage holin family protein [Psychrobacillus psychrotolerans]|uniref:Bacteriophage holin family protein n=1 Tax=Psychrobacillus psychrotolerans TaxID=126156 RepID=A0A1I5W3Y3_9BACI|nr:phage holin family protein [Psychrobacillus psychrotolerans]SFQ14452.1 Bacteriophage holin family protein [Psychrobacillus psychrotolerans]
MTRLQITGFKSIGALLAGFAMYMLQIVNEAIVVLVFLMFLDMLTGVMRSFLTKSWNLLCGKISLNEMPENLYIVLNYNYCLPITI